MRWQTREELKLEVAKLEDTPFDFVAEILRVFTVPAIDLSLQMGSYAQAMEQYRWINGRDPGPPEKHTALIRRPTTALVRVPRTR